MFSRIHPLGLDGSSSRGIVYSRHATGPSKFENFVSPAVPKHCPGATVFEKLASEQRLITRSSSGRISILCLQSSSKSPCTRSLVGGWFDVFSNHVGETIDSGFSSATGLSVLSGSKELDKANSSHMSATAP